MHETPLAERPLHMAIFLKADRLEATQLRSRQA